MCETDFLFARPSFLEGMARVIDLGNTLNIYNDSKTVMEADAIALKNDFEMIGRDIAIAMNAHDKSEEEKEK